MTLLSALRSTRWCWTRRRRTCYVLSNSSSSSCRSSLGILLFISASGSGSGTVLAASCSVATTNWRFSVTKIFTRNYRPRWKPARACPWPQSVWLARQASSLPTVSTVLARPDAAADADSLRDGSRWGVCYQHWLISFKFSWEHVRSSVKMETMMSTFRLCASSNL